jgi:transposase-like protein
MGAMTEPTCPFCSAQTVERVGQWGGQMITAQWRCLACASYFEAIRDDFDAPIRQAVPGRQPSTADHTSEPK